MKDLLLITPPFTQLNTPYPATAYLKGFLNTKDISAFQMDLGIEVILALFSKEGLTEAFHFAEANETIESENAQRIVALKTDYLRTINSVIAFLQGQNPSLARQICTENYLPEASRFTELDYMDYAFGSMGMADKAKHLATLYIEDLTDFIKEGVDPEFGVSRYAEQLGKSANSFDELHEELSYEHSYIDNITISLLEEKLAELQPKLVCLSAPFPGNLFSAFRCAQYIKEHYPHIIIALGGGFANTELRSVSDPRVFDYLDFITLDDGELPIELLHSFATSDEPSKDFLFKRTFLREEGKVIYNNFSLRQDYKQADLGTPDYSDLLLDKYISVIEVANPMHSLWSDGRWNKLTMAHGCYWGKCTFCDVSLDYIGSYEPIAASILVDRMEEIIAQTDERGFHFVDEAAPPALMRELALEILIRKLDVTWWTNIRFEKSFSHDLCTLLKRSGCIAVSGGLEVASDRLLKLIDKGVTVEQVARVTRHFTECGIMVHSYLMYGYPTQTVQETIDSLEMVRQLFEAEVIQSGFWHQFALTAHSPVGLDPDAYGITPHLEKITFANNDVQFTDSTGIDHSQFSFGLKKSLYNYMHGICFDTPLQDWFDFDVPTPTIGSNYIANCLNSESTTLPKATDKLIWINALPGVSQEDDFVTITFHSKKAYDTIELDTDLGLWLAAWLEKMHYATEETITFKQFKTSFEEDYDDIEKLWNSEVIDVAREFGLLVL
ncbi:MAG: B12-binding domain-containing radical SAM protein [Bacteroidia bacterium]